MHFEVQQGSQIWLQSTLPAHGLACTYGLQVPSCHKGCRMRCCFVCPGPYLDFVETIVGGVAAVGHLYLAGQPAVPSDGGKQAGQVLAALLAQLEAGRLGPAALAATCCGHMESPMWVQLDCGLHARELPCPLVHAGGSPSAPEGRMQSPVDVDPMVLVVVLVGQSSHASAVPPAEYVRKGLC